MSNQTIRELKLGRLFAEGLVVVASILIAFALDAWWDDRQLAKEMAEDLAIVDFELSENLRLVDLSIEIMEQVVVASDEIIVAMNANPEALSVEITGGTVFWGLFSSPTLDPSFGGIDSWIAAGRLAGIESIELRQRLASIRGKVSDVIEEQLVAREILIRETHPLLRDEIGSIAAVKELVAAGYGARYGSSVQELPDVGTVSIPTSGAIQFTIEARTLFINAALQEMRDFREELKAIQTLLRGEMTE